MSTRSKRKVVEAAAAAAAAPAPAAPVETPDPIAIAAKPTEEPAGEATVAAVSPNKRAKRSDSAATAAAAAADAAAAAIPTETAAAAVSTTATLVAAAPTLTKPPPKKRSMVTEDLSATIGNPTDPSTFDHYLFQLMVFKSDHNNYHVTKEEYPDLHIWLQFLKREYKNHVQDASASQLTATQFKVLEFLHVPLTSRGDDHWNRFYELLKSYGQRHGHVLVPRLCEVPGLGDWVTDQRRQYKAWKQGQSTQLTKERQDKLEGLGFAWQVRNRPEWEQRFNELTEYKKKHGDCKVPQHYKANRALGKWVAKQREQYKLLKKGSHSFLTPYRLEKLDNAGFCWQVRTALDAGDDEDEVKSEPAAVATTDAEAVATEVKQEVTANGAATSEAVTAMEVEEGQASKPKAVEEEAAAASVVLKVEEMDDATAAKPDETVAEVEEAEQTATV